MKNDEIKYYQYVGSQEDADSYLIRMPMINHIYSENDAIGINIVSYWATESVVGEIHLEWQLVEIF